MKKLFKFLPTILICSIIILLSHKSGLKSNFSQVTDIILRKQAHIFEFALLYLSFFLAISDNIKKIRYSEFKNLSIISFIFVLIFSLSDEWHQSMVISRTAKPIDILYDSLGGLVGYVLMWNIFIYHKIKDNVYEK